MIQISDVLLSVVSQKAKQNRRLLVCLTLGFLSISCLQEQTPVRQLNTKPDPTKDVVDGGDKVRDSLNPLIEDLRGKNLEPRILAALHKLAELGTKAKDAGPDVVEFGLLKGFYSKPLNVLPDTGFSVRFDWTRVRTAASTTLKKIDPEAHKPIVLLLSDLSQRTNVSAIQELAALGKNGKSGLPALKYHYYMKINGPPPVWSTEEAESFLVAITKIAPDDAGVIDTVLKVVAKPFEDMRRRLPSRSFTITLLSEIKTTNKAKANALGKALADSLCRAQTVVALGNLGADAREVLPLLMTLKQDKDQRVREVVEIAIAQIKSD